MKIGKLYFFFNVEVDLNVLLNNDQTVKQQFTIAIF